MAIYAWDNKQNTMREKNYTNVMKIKLKIEMRCV